MTIEQTFEDLFRYEQSLDEEARRAMREGLDEESLAIFDLLRKPDLDAAGIKRIKRVAVELLEKVMGCYGTGIAAGMEYTLFGVFGCLTPVWHFRRKASRPPKLGLYFYPVVRNFKIKADILPPSDPVGICPYAGWLHLTSWGLP